MRLVAVVAALLLALPSRATAQTEVVHYVPPVDGPVVERFSAPLNRYGPGNRGIDYRTTPGTPVRASAAGEVAFAGQVGNRLFVVVRHADGLRTTYGGLARIDIAAGQRVEVDTVLGVSGGRLHFGVRAGDAYVDPEELLGSAPPYVYLVPVDEKAPAVSRRLAEAAHVTTADECTPADVATPRLAKRRIVVLVGGFGSSSKTASILRTDTGALGYAPADVFLFSYRGVGLDYTPSDTVIDIGESAARLREMLQELHRTFPDVDVDLIAHSQGGLVARAFLAFEIETHQSSLPRVGTVVTLGSPHQGTPTADIARELVDDPRLAPLLPADAVSVRQMTRGSDFLRSLEATGPPAGVNAVSIADRADLIVPSPRSRWPGAATVVVSGPVDASRHSNLPAHPSALREIALAVNGAPPTCETPADQVLDVLVGEAIATAGGELAERLAAA